MKEKDRYEKIRKIKDDLAREYLLKLAVDAHLREDSDKRINLGAVCNLLADRIIILEGRGNKI